MKKTDLSNKRIVISRTDSIGDVMLTLPLCKWIKENAPGSTVLFLGKNYTQPVIEPYEFIDGFLNWSEIENTPSVEQLSYFRSLEIDVFIHVFPNKKIASLIKKVRVPVRVGTSHRSFHLLTCNLRPNFTRKNSIYHEAQLNFELLRPFGLSELPSFEYLIDATSAFKPKHEALPDLINEFRDQYPNHVILHPKSQGSAVEWPIEKYIELSEKLSALGYGILFTGTDKEGSLFRDKLPSIPSIIDTTGKLTLSQLILLIQHSSGLVACSTGPLHIAGYLGVKSIGLFSPKRPIHPGRWRPLGRDVHILVNDEKCEKCKRKKPCDCISNIEVDRVLKEFGYIPSSTN